MTVNSSDTGSLGVTRQGFGWSSDLFSSSVVVTGPQKTIYLAGLADNADSDGSVTHVGDFAGQCDATFKRLEEVLAHNGAGLEHIVKITAYVTDVSNLRAYTARRLRAFGDRPLPAHTFIAVSALAMPEMLVEVDATAVCPIS